MTFPSTTPLYGIERGHGSGTAKLGEQLDAMPRGIFLFFDDLA